MRQTRAVAPARLRRFRSWTGLLALAFASGAGAAESLSFNEHIRPILSDNCFACHGTDAAHRKGKLRLDTPEGAFAERNGFRAIVPGKPAESEAWLRIVSEDEEERMPPLDSHKPALKAEQRAVLKRWIEEGASYQKHWSYEPVRPTAPPAPVAGATEHPVDRFIAAKLASHGLTLAAETAPELLLRRVTLDLTGLPPTTEELDAFVADSSPAAYARVVDRLLASTRYGEHFARSWLDAVRYGDTHGMHLDNLRTLWPYRDWVVRAFNENLPFDRFTVEQLAGDLLPQPTRAQLVASGYNRNNLSTSEGGSLEAEAVARNLADRADTTAAVWLGLTTNCASCHDHKFDPLTQKEYYSFAAFFGGLADRAWDGNVRLPGPRVLLADAAQQKRLDEIAAAWPALETALRNRGDQLLPELPKLAKKPVTYEVVWAEDGDAPTVTNFAAPPRAGTWQAGPAVPLAGGQRALRLEGAVERTIDFATGELDLTVRTALRAFAHVYPDPKDPPRALALEFVASGEIKRLVWGDPAAFGPEIAQRAIVAGPLPLPGSYVRLEIDALATGLAAGATYTGVRLVQSDGAAWWDRIGAVCTSPSAADDPLLSIDAWISPLRKGSNDHLLEAVPVPLDMKYLISLFTLQQNADELKRRAQFYRDYIYAPLRGALEPEAHAARRLMVEQVHFERLLPGTLVSRELAEPPPAHVLVRGQYDKPGERVLPGTPAFLPPLTATGPRATRLDLARWLVDAKNPLPARVTVNRFWQQVFGAGLVRTPGDFGSQGEPPTHAALLDWLTAEFVGSGWDVKRLVRLLVTSRTYRQHSQATPALLELDPANKWLARGARFRLDGEVLRDQALALSGLLVPTVGGPPVRPYQPTGVWEPVAYPDSNTLRYVADTGPALYRRSLYTLVKRNAPAPALTTFDAPSREAFCVVRNRTNTPLQALALMNDVQHFEAARVFAARILAQPGTDATRLTRAFRSVTARTPDESERAIVATALATQRTRFAANPAAAQAVLSNGESPAPADLPPGELAAWTLVANLLLNLDETLSRN